jgi:hypothetical protein
MDIKLNSFIDRCLSISVDMDIGLDKPVVISVSTDELESNTRVVLSFTEPYGLKLPLNVVWIVSDPNHLDFRKILKRESKNASNNSVHSWVEVTSLSDVFEPAQFWSQEDLSYMESSISDMLDHLILKADTDVHGSSAFTIKEIRRIQSSFGSAYSNLNQTVVYNDARIRDLESRNSKILEDLASSIQRVEKLEKSVSGSGKSYTHVAVEASRNWNIKHNLKSKNLICQIYEGVRDSVLPSSIEFISINSCLITFAVPQAGRAVLIES